MTILCLVRHGDYTLLNRALGGRADYGLSDEGHAQAARAATRIAARAVSAVVSSPVRRALQTAAPIAAATSHAITQDSAFSEIDFGAWAGQTFETLDDDPAWHTWNTARSTASTPGGETMLAAQCRAWAGVHRLGAKYPNGEIAIVSHADIIKAIVLHAMGMSLDSMQRLQIEPGSITRLDVGPRNTKLLSLEQP